MTRTDIDSYLEGLEKVLLGNDNIYPVLLCREWVNSLKKDFNGPGVYVFFEEGKPCYVGETGNIKKRMNDLRNTLNHSLRRNFGHKHFNKHLEFNKATSKRKFHASIEELLNELMKNNLQVSMLRVDLGRKELEEHVCEKYQLLEKYNIRSKRKQ